MSVDEQPLVVKNAGPGAIGTIRVAAGKTVVLHAGYRSQGLDDWRYKFGEGISQIPNFRLDMHTNFKDIDFPETTISPPAKRETANGWDLTWNYKNLVSGYEIGMAMPEKLQPGPLAGEISYFAPVSLFFFFFLIFIITALRGIDLHPMNYFFLATAFFWFSSSFGVPGGSHFDSRSVCNLLPGFDLSGCELPTARGGNPLRCRGGWFGAVHFPGAVLVCLFL
jgi:hypothetical protein